MKQYVRPELYYENFELSQHIAACSIVIQTESVVNCTAIGTITNVPPIFGSTIQSSAWFIPANVACTVQYTDVFCYTTGSLNSANINS